MKAIVQRVVPKSLIGQIALVMAIALLLAQAINFSLIFTERQRVSRAQIEGPAVARFVLSAQRIANGLPARARDGPFSGSPIERRRRVTIDDASSVPAARNDPWLVERLRADASSNGLALRDARAFAEEIAFRRPSMDHDAPSGRGSALRGRSEIRLQRLILSVQLADGRWVNGRALTPRANPWLALRPALATLLTYLIVLAAMLFVAIRIARPLRDLTLAAQGFRGNGEAPRVAPRGPADVSRAIEAFNAMGMRVSTMIDEKDRMLGAIGHDLRTPLASLRIRAESVEPADERAHMIATIEEMTAMLDDTLALARSGRAVEPLRSVDVSALADAVVEEFRALGAEVEMEAGARQTGLIRPRLLRRAVRNLVENAVKYAGAARVAVRDLGPDELAIEIVDDGPGIPESEIEKVQEAFYRIEPSRSRETGGSGLGLTLARAAAQAHCGQLELENRPEGGLRVRLAIPRAAGAA